MLIFEILSVHYYIKARKIGSKPWWFFGTQTK